MKYLRNYRIIREVNARFRHDYIDSNLRHEKKFDTAQKYCPLRNRLKVTKKCAILTEVKY
jgi:hypothetical protein